MTRDEGERRLRPGASDDREDKRSRLLLVATGIAVIVSAGLFVWQVLDRSPEEADDGNLVIDPASPSSSGGTVADFLRERLSPDQPATPTAQPDQPSPTPSARRRERSAPLAPSGAAVGEPAPVPASPAAPRASYAGPDKSAVRRTTLRALKRGETQLWKHNGQRGYVLVSGSADYGDRTCRQVSYTLIADGGAQVTSDPVQWCQIKRGEWGEDPYTGR